MPQNFIESGREQGFLLPPDVREWLAADHLAWFVIDAVAQMDLSAFYAAYRADGHGRAAYEPSVMVTVVLYAHATGRRSSRAIERYCRQDVAYRVITGNLVPDHATIARFGTAREKLRAGAVEELSGPEAEEPVEPRFGFDVRRIVARTQGLEVWLLEARRQLEQ